MRSAVAYLPTKNLLHNITILKQVAPNSQLIAMIKANAYGHGLRSTAIRLQAQTDFFGVASIDEALQLRKIGITNKIFLMEGIFEPQELPIAYQENLVIVFHNQQQIDWLQHYINHGNQKTLIHAWIKIDTGMGRLGFNLEEAHNIYQYLVTNNNVKHPIGVMSHFACADLREHPLNNQQIINFNNFETITTIKTLNYHHLKSFCNSAAIFNFPQQQYDIVRPGLALYGISPLVTKSSKELRLKPVMQLQTKVIAIKYLPKHSSVGYGAQYICNRDTTVAMIAIGYGDGYPQSATTKGIPVVINNQRFYTIGRVSMDMSAVDITEGSGIHIGDNVILWGEALPLEEIANASQHSVYNLLTAVQHRVKFFWH